MRQKALFLTGLTFLAACCAASAANDLRNASFEEEIGEESWHQSWGTFSVEDWNSPPDGDRAGYIKGRWAGGDNGGVLQSVEAIPFSTYELSAYFYFDNDWSAGQKAMKLEFFDAEDNLLHSKVDELDGLSQGKWVRKRILAKAPEYAVRVQVVIEASETGGDGVLGVDDVKLVR